MPSLKQKVEIALLEGPSEGVYHTFVEDIDSESLTLGHPLQGVRPVSLDVGSRLQVEYVTANERVVYAATILRLQNKETPVVVVTLPEEGSAHRFQQRNFVRLEVNLALTFSVVIRPDNEPITGEVFSSRTRDISGNGAQILCSEPYPPGSQLKMFLDLNGQSMRVSGEVVRQGQEVRSREYWVGVRFLSVTEADRDAIIRYIFQEQLARRRRGLI